MAQVKQQFPYLLRDMLDQPTNKLITNDGLYGDWCCLAFSLMIEKENLTDFEVLRGGVERFVFQQLASLPPQSPYSDHFFIEIFKKEIVRHIVQSGSWASEKIVEVDVDIEICRAKQRAIKFREQCAKITSPKETE